MAILLTKQTRVCVLGITGGQARKDILRNIELGTEIVCGVAPGRGGLDVSGIPVFETAAEAAAEVGYDAVVAYLPPAKAEAALLDVINTLPRWVLVITEGIPVHSSMVAVESARQLGVRLVGPNTAGMISPGVGNVGFTGASGAFQPGTIGILSRSGGVTAEISSMLSRYDFGVSTAVGIGADAVVGSSFADLLVEFEADPSTRGVAMYCEAGPVAEQSVVEALHQASYTKPLVALVAGDYLQDHPPGTSFGHAGSFLAGGDTTAAAKRAMLSASGVPVAEASVDIGRYLRSMLPEGR